MHFDYLTWFFRRFNAFVLAVFVLLIPFSKLRQPFHFDADHSADKTNYPFVMIHGFQSWNEDAPNNAYKGMQYWGMLNGDAPSAAAAGQATPGVYNVFPTVRASHMWPIGDFVSPKLDGPIYVLHLMEMINAL